MQFGVTRGERPWNDYSKVLTYKCAKGFLEVVSELQYQVKPLKKTHPSVDIVSE